MAKIPKELETAILELSSKERDKMLLKLIAKNALLVQQLYFQLLEDETDLKQKRENIKNNILKVSQYVQQTTGWLMMDMRSLNAEITHYVKVTKDKYGEVELTLFLLNSFFEFQLPLLEKQNNKTYKTGEYIAKRVDFLMKKLPKLNEDYYIEFYDATNKLLENIHKYCPAPFARQLNLPKSWEY